MLLVSASPPGKEAYRSARDGSWLLQQLRDSLKNPTTHEAHPGTIDLLDVLTDVCRNMSVMKTNSKKNCPAKHGSKVVPVIEHQLLKSLMIMY